MLVLSRKRGEAIVIADANLVISILDLNGSRVRIGIEAPPEMRVYRREVWEQIRGQVKDANIECASSLGPPAPADALP